MGPGERLLYGINTPASELHAYNAATNTWAFVGDTTQPASRWGLAFVVYYI